MPADIVAALGGLASTNGFDWGTVAVGSFGNGNEQTIVFNPGVGNAATEFFFTCAAIATFSPAGVSTVVATHAGYDGTNLTVKLRIVDGFSNNGTTLRWFGYSKA